MDTTASKEDFFTVTQLAKAWSVSPVHLYNLINKYRTLRAYRVGYRLIVKKSDAEAYLKAHETVTVDAVAN